MQINNLKEEPSDTFRSFIKLLQTPSKERKTKEINQIIHFLEKTKLAQKFIQENMPDSSLHKMLFFCSQNLYYRFIEKGEYLFKEGDIGDNFYIILKGDMSVYKLMEKRVSMSAEQYIRHLLLLKKEKSIDIVKRTINLNNSIFYVDIGDLDELNEIILRIFIRKAIASKRTKEEIENILISFGKEVGNYTFNYIDGSLLIEDKTSRKSFGSNIYGRDSESIKYSNFNLQNYLYIESKTERDVRLLCDNFILDLTVGSYLGDLALDNKNQIRSASIVANEDTHLGVLSQYIYKIYISNEKQKLRVKEVNFLLNNMVFKSMKYFTFYSRYFNFFVETEFDQNKILFQEKENITNLYFIRDGELELSINVNLDGLNEIINGLIRKLKVKMKEFKKISEESGNHQYRDYYKVKNFRIFYLSSGEEVGYEDFLYNNYQRFFQGKVHSARIKIYKLNHEIFLKMIKEDKETKHNFEIKAEQKINLLLERLIEIRSHYLNEMISMKPSDQQNHSHVPKYNKINNLHMDVMEDHANTMISTKDDSDLKKMINLKTVGTLFHPKLKASKKNHSSFFISAQPKPFSPLKLNIEKPKHSLENLTTDENLKLPVMNKKKSMNEIISTLNIEEIKYKKLLKKLENSSLNKNISLQENEEKCVGSNNRLKLTFNKENREFEKPFNSEHDSFRNTLINLKSNCFNYDDTIESKSKAKKESLYKESPFFYYSTGKKKLIKLEDTSSMKEIGNEKEEKKKEDLFSNVKFFPSFSKNTNGLNYVFEAIKNKRKIILKK